MQYKDVSYPEEDDRVAEASPPQPAPSLGPSTKKSSLLLCLPPSASIPTKTLSQLTEGNKALFELLLGTVIAWIKQQFQTTATSSWLPLVPVTHPWSLDLPLSMPALWGNCRAANEVM